MPRIARGFADNQIYHIINRGNRREVVFHDRYDCKRFMELFYSLFPIVIRLFVMSEAEKIKEQIGWLKVIFGILSAVVVSLMGWLATNYNSAGNITLILATILIVLLSFAIMFINKKAFEKLTMGDL